MSQNYKRFMTILEKWPVDKTKNNRDLGFFLREKLSTQFSGTSIISSKDQKHIEKQFEALENLVKNVHHDKYKRKYTSTSTGLTGEQCRQVLSSEFLEKYSSSMHYIKQIIKPKKSHQPHVPVMLNETLEYLNPSSHEIFIDMTFGSGGHTRKILESAENVRVFALDRDPTAHSYASQLADEFPGRLIPLLGKFSELPDLLHQHEIKPNSIDGILFDFGCSSMQFDEGPRGFSISKNGYLDMRMDQNRFPNQPNVADILAKIDEYDLAKILKTYGDEKNAKKIAKAIVDARYSVKRIETTKELADIVEACCGSEPRLDRHSRPSHVATKTFQALRIFVNNEMNEINFGMIVAEKYLKIGGRLVTITFHSLEDTIVKRHIMGNITDDVANEVPLKYISHLLCHGEDKLNVMFQTNWHQLHRHVLTPRFEEIEENPRSRSAKFRAVLKYQN